MQGPHCNGHAMYAFDLADGMDDHDNDDEFEEMDPHGRYGRYKDILGRGAFKTVYKAFDRVEGIEVAWNQIKLQNVVHSPVDLERLFSEVHFLKNLKHKNIIKFYHSWVDMETQNLNFLTEMFTSGTLRQYRRQHRYVDIRAIKNWCRQILRGLLYLHSHDPPIIHRDLKCDNIFINGNLGEVKIGDLGLATILRPTQSVIGTPEFMAPELYEEEYTELVDIYAFGMCLLEMVTCKYPYSECTNAAQIYKRVTSGKKPEALSKVRDPLLRQFVEKCIAPASSRLPARELLMDPFLQCDRETDYGENLPFTSKGFARASSVNVFESFSNKNTKASHLASRSMASLSSLSQAPVLPALPRGRGTWQDSAKSAPNALPSSHLLEDTAGQIMGARVKDESVSKTLSSSQGVDNNGGQIMDIQVKGKRREQDTVHLRLRIADPEGDVRSIGFLFKLGLDTANSVVVEMASELNLTDQDVTKIIERINTALAVIAPEWRPAVAVNDEAEDEYLSKLPAYSDPLHVDWASDCTTSAFSERLSSHHSEHSLVI